MSPYSYVAGPSSREAPSDHVFGRIRVHWGHQSETLRVHSLTIDNAVDIALNANLSDKAESIDFSYAEDEEAGLEAAEQQRNIRRYYM